MAALVVACGSTPRPTPTPTPRHTPTPAPATPTPGPDTENVSVQASGVGSWQLVAIPVAVLHNDARRHGAEEVVVHFTTHGPGGETNTLDSEAVNLAPGETLPVAADCTDGCNGATGVDVLLTVGLWTATIGPSFTAGPAAYTCGTGACGGGQGEGSVAGQLTASATLAQGTTLVAAAVCTDAGGVIVGAGETQTGWAGGASAGVHVPVIVNRSPASCQIGASTGW